MGFPDHSSQQQLQVSAHVKECSKHLIRPNIRIFFETLSVDFERPEGVKLVGRDAWQGTQEGIE